jgi:predicted component of type VI protein secretion system
MLSEKYFLVIQNGIRAGQRIPIHKWMSATGGGNKVSIGMTGECEIQMNWEKSNKVAKEHARLYIDHEKTLPMIKPMATGVVFNNGSELAVGKPYVLSNGDTFKIGDTIFQYVESE